MSSKSKRRVTVDPGNTVSDDAEKRKPSVFERLGPGAGQRKYSEYDSEREKKCRPFLLTGECPYGANCKYKHVQLSSKSRTREDDTSPENLRLKLKSGQSERSSDKRRDSDSELHEPHGRSSSHSRRDKDSEAGDRQDRPSSHTRRDKETKIRSQVVVKKSENQDSDDSGDDSESNWFNSLDYKKELELEQKRQQLQRELSQLAEEEVENITIQKKVPVSQSGSESSPERGRTGKRLMSPHDKHVTSPHDKRSTSPGGRAKKEKKKHRTKSPPDVPVKEKKHSSPGPDRIREHKRKHEVEEEPHKKHKKKKERKRSLSPPPEVRGKKKDKWAEEPESTVSRSHSESVSASRQHSQSHSKHSRTSSSDSSLSPPRTKEGKVKGKGKTKKKKNRGGKGESDSDESHTTKSKKWLSPLKKTLKLKKAKASGSMGDVKGEEERVKQRSASPKAARRRDLLEEDPMPPSRSHEPRRDSEVPRSRGHSLEKRDKKHKGRQSESPAPLIERSSSSKRADTSRDVPYSRKGRQSESPTERSSSSKRGDSSRDMLFDRRKPDQRDRGDVRKGGAEERQKRTSSLPRQAEMYSPSQLDRESPVREPSQRLQQPVSRGRQAGEREPPREEERRGQDRDGRRGDKFESRSSAATQDRPGQERFGRRGNGDSFDQYGQDRGRFDADRNRWEYREGRGQDASGDREQRGRRGDHFERGPPPRDAPRSEGIVRDVPFDRQDNMRGAGSREGRDMPRDNDGRDRARDVTRDRGDNRDTRDRDRLPLSEGRLFRDDGRDGGDRRGRDLSADGRPPVEGSRMDRPDVRPDRGDIRLDRGDGRLDRGDGRMDRGDGRLERGDSRGEGRMDRGEGRLERGDSRGDRGLVRGDSRHERTDNRMDRGDNRLDRGDNRMDRGDVPIDHRRGDPSALPVDQRGFRQGRGDGRGGMRGVGSHSPVDNRSFEFDRPGDRDSRLERDRELAGMGGLPPPPRDRFMPGGDFRRDEPGYRENLPEPGPMRDRRGDDRFSGPENIPPRGERPRFDDIRDDRMQGRGQGDERQGRDRMIPRHGGHYDFGRVPPVPDVRVPDLPPNQRRGPLLPTPSPVEEPPPPARRGGRGEPPRGARDARENRGRRDQRDADFGPEAGRGGRDAPRDIREPGWERDASKEGRLLGRDGSRDGSRDLPGRRNRGMPTEDITPDADRNRDADRSDSQRRDRDRSPRLDRKDGTAQVVDPGSKRMSDRKEGGDGEKLDASDARSTRSADDVRELASQRKRKEGETAGSGPALLKGVRDRDSQSDGKRSPGPERSKGRSPLSFSGRRQPVRARSLSPKQRCQSPLAAGSQEGGRSQAKLRSPSRRGADLVPSPLARGARGDRSRTPLGTKRKLEEDLHRSPRGKDDTKSPVAKRAREESRSPVRKGSRHPSPAGSHHSRSSHSSVERRRRTGLMQRDQENRFFTSAHDRDSPARRDREREKDSPAWREREKDSPARREREKEAAKLEKASDSSKGDSDKADGSRKRGRSPPRSQGRGSDSGDRSRKRWKGDGSWSETEGGDVADKDAHRQKMGGMEQPRAAEPVREAGDSDRPDTAKALSSASGTPTDMAKGGRPGRGDIFGGRGNEDRIPPDARANRGDDSFHRGLGRPGFGMDGDSSLHQDSADDSKDASLGNMLYEDDYEKISSDESDFEADDGEKPSQNIVSVLDIDWASLAKKPTPKQTAGSLLKRFHPANVFRQIGISRALAGDALFEKVKAICKEGVTVAGTNEEKDKENVDQSSETTQTKGTKREAPTIDTSLQSDVPVLHMAAVRQKRERANLLRNLGPFRRALCARRDLEIRRQLCKVDKVYEQPAVFPIHVMDTDLCKLSMQLFRQGRDFVERKDSECDGKIELSI